MSTEPHPATDCERQLLDFIREQRWFGAREAEPTGIFIIDEAQLRDHPARTIDALADIRFGNGASDHYQLLLDAPAARGEVPSAAGARRDAFADPSLVEELLRLVHTAATVPARDGTVEFCATAQSEAPPPTPRDVRALGVEQSNSSIVVDDALFVKLYRRIEAGINPELELLRFLRARGFPHVPELVGWWSYSGSAMNATLGLVQRFLPEAIDGWSLAIDELAHRPQEFIARIARLGEVIGLMHRTLASDLDDSSGFAPEESSPETLALFTATLDDEIDAVFDRLSDDDPTVAPLIGRAGALRDLLQMIATTSSIGRVIRCHGDLHLGQVLWAYGDWFIVDFEGEPARAASERRIKRSPLRDVAGMLRSFAYAVTLTEGGEETERHIRMSFLDTYFAAVQSAGVLPPAEQIERLLTLFELERAVYELRYELAHRPDWLGVPVAGILALLERGVC